MALEQYQYVTLEDNQVYIVLETILLDGKSYFYLMEKDHMDQLGFYQEIHTKDGIKLERVNDEQSLKNIQVAFLEKMKYNIENRNS